jgi:ESS family glutamate:Na+ symporter
MTIDLDPVQTLAAALLVLSIGTLVIAALAFLRNNDIPVPVVGGILFAAGTGLLYAGFDVRISFDMELRDPMILAFFATIGLSADLRSLRRGGKELLLLAGVCLLYLVLQNSLGLLTALSMDLHPLVGLLSASVTLSGGHGTGAAYARQFAGIQNLAGAMELAMACATVGLIIGGLLGGPVGGRLIRRHRLEPENRSTRAAAASAPAERGEGPITSATLLGALFSVVACLVGGQALAGLLSGAAFALPSFVWCLFVGVTIRNVATLLPALRPHGPTVEVISNLSLALFLAMALMSLRLWELASLAGPLLVLIGVQAIGLAAFASYVTFRVMGRSYDAAIIASGHCGFGMGATPTAVANMEALTRRFGPSRQAFLVVPLMGAFFIDVLNAVVIQGFLALPIPGF